MDVAFVLVAVLAAVYFILLRPVINQQKKQRQDISSLEIGDEVLTTGGFYAIVVEINTYEDRPMEILLEVAPDVVLRGTTLSIAEISRRADEIDDEYDDTDDDDSDEDDGGGDVSPAGESDDEDRSSSARAG